MDRSIDEWTYRWMMVGRMEEWIDGEMMDEWIDRHVDDGLMTDTWMDDRQVD